jgi:hypothetical protein
MLQLAIRHKDADLVQQLYRFPAADGISCDNAADLLKAAVCQQAAACALGLCKLRAVLSLRSERVSPLLAMAVIRRDANCLSGLVMGLSYALQLAPACLVPAIEAAVAIDATGFVRRLCRLNAAQHLSTVHVVELLRDAEKLGRADCLAALCQLPAAQRMSSADVLHKLMIYAARMMVLTAFCSCLHCL